MEEPRSISCVKLDLMGTVEGTFNAHKDHNLIGLSNFLDDLQAAIPQSTAAQIVQQVEDTLNKIAEEHGPELLKKGLSLELKLSKTKTKELSLQFNFNFKDR